MSNQHGNHQQALDIGIAMLHGDGMISLPRVGVVQSLQEDVPFDDGVFDVQPGRITVRSTARGERTLSYCNGRWELDAAETSKDVAGVLATAGVMLFVLCFISVVVVLFRAIF